MTISLEQRLRDRAVEAGYPKSELYREAADRIAFAEDIISRMRTHVLSANQTANLVDKQAFLDAAVMLSRAPSLTINQSS